MTSKGNECIGCKFNTGHVRECPCYIAPKEDRMKALDELAAMPDKVTGQMAAPNSKEWENKVWMWAANELPKGIHSDKFEPLFQIIKDLLEKEYMRGNDAGVMIGKELDDAYIKDILAAQKQSILTLIGGMKEKDIREKLLFSRTWRAGFHTALTDLTSKIKENI